MRKIMISSVICLIGIMLGLVMHFEIVKVYDSYIEINKHLEAKEVTKVYGMLNSANVVERKLYKKCITDRIPKIREEYDNNKMSIKEIVENMEYLLQIIEESNYYVSQEDKNNIVELMDVNKLIDDGLNADLNLLTMNETSNLIFQDSQVNIDEVELFEGNQDEYSNMVNIQKYWHDIITFNPSYTDSDQGIIISNRIKSINNAKKKYFEIIINIENNELLSLCNEIVNISSDENDKVFQYKKEKAVLYMARKGVGQCKTKEETKQFIETLKDSCSMSDEDIDNLIIEVVNSGINKLDRVEVVNEEELNEILVCFHLDLREEQKQQLCNTIVECFDEEYTIQGLKNLELICSTLMISNTDLFGLVKNTLQMDRLEKTLKDYMIYLLQIQKSFEKDQDIQKTINNHMQEELSNLGSSLDELYNTQDYNDLFNLVNELINIFQGNEEYIDLLKETKSEYLAKVKEKLMADLCTYDANIYAESATITKELIALFPEDEDLYKYDSRFGNEPWKNAYLSVIDTMKEHEKGALVKLSSESNPVLALWSNETIKFLKLQENEIKTIKEIKAYYYSPAYNAQNWYTGYLFQNGDDFLVNSKYIGYPVENGEMESFQFTRFSLNGEGEDIWYRISHSEKTGTFIIWEYDIPSVTIFNRTDVFEDGDDAEIRSAYNEFFNNGETVIMSDSNQLKKLIEEE